MDGVLKRLWMRAVLVGSRYGDHRVLGAMYWLRDPWDMASPRERFRFEETNRLIGNEFGRPGRLLEIGCGEGHQSERLLEVCDVLYGIDLSSRAVARARARCRTGTFDVGDMFHAAMLPRVAPVDLVVACEVLYYMDDITAALRRMSTMGNACFVTYHVGYSERLDPHICAIDNRQTSTFNFGAIEWKAVWWRASVPSGHEGKSPLS